MLRRNFLLGLSWMTLLGWAWAQPTPEQLASLLLGQPVDRVPQETLEDLQLLRTRPLAELPNWPAGEQAAQRVLLRLLEGRAWPWVPFANAPAQPPAQRADWGQPWPTITK